MKKFLSSPLTHILIFAILWVVAACSAPLPTDSRALQKWEYKVVYTPAASNSTSLGTSIKIDEVTLAANGKDGWELVAMNEEYNTVFPNFSADTKIVTGIESNVRPLQLVLVFKRPLK